jgi:two-component system, OmpR family, sensor kinase
MTLRGRLLLALAYLLLAIVALEVPLAISLRDRVDAEVRSQARSQADVVAASVAGNLDDPESLDDTVRRAAEATRGRVVVTDIDGALLSDSAGTRPAPTGSAPTTGTARRSPRRCAPAARCRTAAAARRSTRRSSPRPCRWLRRARASAPCA